MLSESLLFWNSAVICIGLASSLLHVISSLNNWLVLRTLCQQCLNPSAPELNMVEERVEVRV